MGLLQSVDLQNEIVRLKIELERRGGAPGVSIGWPTHHVRERTELLSKLSNFAIVTGM